MSIVEMIDEIDRLVSNQGTVSQIKPVIIPLREQAEALEKRVRTLESKSKVKDLEGQVSFLRSELDSALKQIQELEKPQQGAHGSDTEDGETKVLVYLSQDTEGPTAPHIAFSLGMGLQVVQFHLDEMSKKEFVYGCHYYGGQESEWFLGNDGRAHLFKLGLLK